MSCQRLLPDVLPPGDTVQATHYLHLEPLPRQVGEARRFVREHAPPLPHETADVLLLLTSELVTNAVLHARTRIGLGMTVAEHSLLVTVHDEDASRREQRPYDAREGGWGLRLVGALAARSDLTVFPGHGKTAWFILPRSGAVTADPDAAARDVDLGGAL
jgi:anti-sigma regulatory factor (Ser/Thr protein kinase)